MGLDEELAKLTQELSALKELRTQEIAKTDNLVQPKYTVKVTMGCGYCADGDHEQTYDCAGDSKIPLDSTYRPMVCEGCGYPIVVDKVEIIFVQKKEADN